MNLPAAVAETHIGVVVFIGDRAYKLKKPAYNGFLDFRTREARKAACDREVELNRRFSPDVYLGVSDVLGTDGEVCDHLVVMRRLDSSSRLSKLVMARDDAVPGALREVAHELASWHAKAPRSPEISAEGARDALRGRWRASFAECKPYALPEAEEIERLTLRFLAGREALFERRIAQGRIVDGHGDLIADDVFCLADGPRLLDCLEFDDRLRHVDGLDDAAFLAMDLERLHAPDQARAFLDWYSEFSGDPAPASLRHHYVAYRAFVRAKVACLSDDLGQARSYAALSLRHLQAGAVSLVLVGGLPGTGKSTLANALAGKLGWTVLSSDRIRKELAEMPAEQSAHAGYRAGIYNEDFTSLTYSELLRRAERLLSLGEPVILDASWTAENNRRAALALADRTSSDLVSLRCQVPVEVATERIRARKGGASDADANIAAAMSAAEDPWPQATEIGTAWGVDSALTHALKVVRPAGAQHHWPLRPQMEAD